MLSLILSGALTTAVLGHNGAFVVAEPLQGITIDGDLSDWPEGMTSYRTSHVDCGVEPLNEVDLSAVFRVACDVSKRSVLIAVEVIDDSPVLDSDPECAWDTQDGFSIYLDRVHSKTGAAPEQYFQCGEDLRTHGAAEGSDVRIKVKRAESKWIYECAIQLGDAFVMGRSFGFDLDVTDKDGDGSFTWQAWTGGVQKVLDPTRLGDLFLLPPEVAFGSVTGQVEWKEVPATVGFPRLSFQSQSNPLLRVDCACDATGAYRAILPEGNYIASPISREGARVVESDHLHVLAFPNVNVEADRLAITPIAEQDPSEPESDEP